MRGIGFLSVATVLALVMIIGFAGSQSSADDTNWKSVMQRECAVIDSAERFADCSWYSLYADALEQASMNLDFMEQVYEDFAELNVFAPCEFLRDNLDPAIFRFEEEVDAQVTIDVKDCRVVGEIYRHIAGIPPKWEYCGATEYSYASFEVCMRLGLMRPGEAEALARFNERMVSVVGEELAIDAIDAWSSLSTEEDRLENVQNNLDEIKRDANRCLRNGDPISVYRTNQIYGDLVSGWHGDSSYDADSPRDRAKNWVTCEHVIRLAVAMDLLGDDAMAEYERRQQEALAARCNPARAQTQPTSEDLLNGLNAWMAGKCTTSEALFDMLGSSGTQGNISGLIVARLEPRNGWCTVSAMPVSLSFQFAPLEDASCNQIAEGVYRCAATSELICFSNAEDDMRARLECALFEIQQQVVMEASYDADACDWQVRRIIE